MISNSSRSLSKRRVILAALLTMTGLFATTYYIAMLRAGHATQSWRRTTGTIVEASPGFCKPHLRYTYRNRHNYAFEGHVWRLSSCLTMRDIYAVPLTTRFREGSTVPVYYDPYVQTRAVLERGAPRGAERVGIPAILLLIAGAAMLWHTLRRSDYRTFDGSGSKKLFIGFFVTLSVAVALANAIRIFVMDAWTKFGGVGGWVTDTFFGVLVAAVVGGVLLVAVRLNRRWLPAIPDNRQLLAGVACAIIFVVISFTPQSHDLITAYFFGQARVLSLLNVPSLFVLLIMGIGTAESREALNR